MDNTDTLEQGLATAPRSVWGRALWMVVMALFYQFAGTLLGLLAMAQLVLAPATGKPNARLCRLASSLGRYLCQIACFVGYSSEQLQFTMARWRRDVSQP